MNSSIYLRPLVADDAKVSYRWRNNPDVWKHSRFNPSEIITIDTESKWLIESLSCKDQIRFAICMEGTEEYIGNVQLIKITKKDAEFHFFIGQPRWWGKGIGYKASSLILNYAFSNLKLQSISLEVHNENNAALAIYHRHGFVTKEICHPYNLMELTNKTFFNVTTQVPSNLLY
ncbi:diamine N-acetyltransferase [Pedobacter sp. CG_S7]|uniref:GNAT family N-acetyltransferase n=1 Tax=Pedobacter sp. CG_S7 TaxID=3143930 RepID=UPI00339979F5